MCIYCNFPLKPIFLDPSLGGYTEDETTNPLAEYGRSKLEMEKELMAVSKG